MIHRDVANIMIVEDEVLIAMQLEDLLISMGHNIVATASHLHDALNFAKTINMDFAILDINLNGIKSFPVAEILRERGILFLLTSGYGIEGLIEGYRHETV